MIRNDKQVSFHVAVDDKEAVQGLPLERNAWVVVMETVQVIESLLV